VIRAKVGHKGLRVWRLVGVERGLSHGQPPRWTSTEHAPLIVTIIDFRYIAINPSLPYLLRLNHLSEFSGINIREIDKGRTLVITFCCNLSNLPWKTRRIPNRYVVLKGLWFGAISIRKLKEGLGNWTQSCSTIFLGAGEIFRSHQYKYCVC